MRELVWAPIAIGSLAIANPVLAQDNAAEPETGVPTQDRMDEFAGMMAGLFQTEPLTGEQQARLPASQNAVGKMMPDGFYGKMMGDMMDKMMRPMMSMFASPELVLGSRLEIDQETLAGLGEAEQFEVVTMLDPAYDQRVDVIVSVITGKMTGMFSAMEGPMREGLSKAYAVRFDDAQLADIGAFFSTPTGGVYAKIDGAVRRSAGHAGEHPGITCHDERIWRHGNSDEGSNGFAAERASIRRPHSRTTRTAGRSSGAEPRQLGRYRQAA